MTRDEAIKRIKAWNLDSDDREILAVIIPELKESEDERIRKELKEAFEAYDIESKWNGIPIRSIFAWLEKQKEQEPADLSEMMVHKEPYIAPVPTPMVADEQKPEWSEDYREEDIQTRFAFYTYKNEEDDGVLYLSNVFVEESSRNHGFGTKILRAAEKVAETIGATTICLKVKQDSPANAWYRKNGYGYVAFEDGYDWLEKNLEYLKPKKGIGWSEEDEKKLQECIKIVERWEEDYDIAYAPYSNTLKSLRPQPKDEIYKEKYEAFKLGKHQLAIKFMNYLDENRPEGKMSLSNAECEDIDKAFKENDWERIMRYTNKYVWKPSKEQVEAFEVTMTYIPEFYKPKSNLASLLRDLKKQV